MFEISIVKTFTTDLSVIDYLLQEQGEKLWMGSNIHSELNHGIKCELHHLQIQDNNFTMISRMDMKIWDMVRLSQNTLLLSVGESRLKLLDTETGEVTDSVYDVSPFRSLAVHITRNDQVIIGGEKDDRGVITVLDREGAKLASFEHDQNNHPMFSYPYSIATTSNGNIFVADYDPSADETWVVILDKNGRKLTRYTGSPEINNRYKELHPSSAASVVATPSDPVLVADNDNHVIHILDNAGTLATLIRTGQKGIFHPYSLAIVDDGYLMIGSTASSEKATLYKVEIAGL